MHTFLLLHCCCLRTFCQSVCCYGNIPLAPSTPPSSKTSTSIPQSSTHRSLNEFSSISYTLAPTLCLKTPIFPSEFYDSMHHLIMWLRQYTRVLDQKTDNYTTPGPHKINKHKIFIKEKFESLVIKNVMMLFLPFHKIIHQKAIQNEKRRIVRVLKRD